jgi:hypothetical protein
VVQSRDVLRRVSYKKHIMGIPGKGWIFVGPFWDMSKLGVQLPYFEWWNRQQTLSGEEWLGEASGHVAGPGSRSCWQLPPVRSNFEQCASNLLTPATSCTPIPWYSHNIHPQIPLFIGKTVNFSPYFWWSLLFRNAQGDPNDERVRCSRCSNKTPTSTPKSPS